MIILSFIYFQTLDSLAIPVPLISCALLWQENSQITNYICNFLARLNKNILKEREWLCSQVFENKQKTK